MVSIERRSISERTASVGGGAKKAPKWLPLVSEIQDLAPEGLLVLKPDEGEAPRAVKVQVSRAAKAAGRKDDIVYGENSEGQIEVWLRQRPKQKRGPRKPRSTSND